HDQLVDRLAQDRVEQSRLVAEDVVDRGRRVAAAQGEAPDRETFRAALVEQPGGRIEDFAARIAGRGLPCRRGFGMGHGWFRIGSGAGRCREPRQLLPSPNGLRSANSVKEWVTVL